MSDFDSLAKKLAPHYSKFDVSNRLLFTGHSHQAWPDVAAEGVQQGFEAAARHVDDKWGVAFEQAEHLRGYLRKWYDDPDGRYCLAENTHLLLVSWLSSLDLKNKPKIISTTGEFHSMYRQLHRLEEEGVEVVWLDPEPSDTFMDRLASHADDQTAAIMLSRIFFETALINQNLTEVAQYAREREIPVLIDDYHGTNVAPLSIKEADLEDCYLLIGGYKYLQWGEGNCFMRFPRDCQLRPVITGWFASFATMENSRNDDLTHYDDSDQRFATGTYDPISQFRAARVVDFFVEQGLTPSVLRQQYVTQLQLLLSLFKAEDLDPKIIKLMHNKSLEYNGGFLAFRSPVAGQLQSMLKSKGMFTDYRGEIIRLGVAPYITSDQIKQASSLLADCVKEVSA